MAAVVGAVLVLLRDQLSGLADPDVLGVLVGVSALLAEGVRLRRLVRTWRQPPGAASQGPSPASNGRDG